MAVKSFYEYYAANYEDLITKELRDLLDLGDYKEFKAIKEQNKTPDIPKDYFDKLISTLIYIINSNDEPDHIRATLPALEVEENLDLLIEEINNVEITENNALKVISYFHCRFETIHPFAAGNGRIGRLLINYLLIGNSLPPIILFENDCEEYYLALEYFNSKQEIDKMFKFLDDQAYKTWVKDYNVKLKSLKDFLV